MSNVFYDYGNFYEDVDEIIELCGTWWYDSSFYKNTKMEYKVDKAQFEQLWLTNNLILVLGREEDTNRLVSCYVGYKAPYYFNNNYLVSNEVVWCVHPDYRKGREALNLLKAIDMAMKGHKVNMYMLALPLLENKETLEKYMVKKLGYFVQDSNLVKEIKYG